MIEGSRLKSLLLRLHVLRIPPAVRDFEFVLLEKGQYLELETIFSLDYQIIQICRPQ